MLGALFMEYYSYSMNSAPSVDKKQKTKTQTWGLKRRSKPTLNKLAFQPASHTRACARVRAHTHTHKSWPTVSFSLGNYVPKVSLYYLSPASSS